MASRRATDAQQTASSQPTTQQNGVNRPPVQGQQTNDYAEFQRLVGETHPEVLRYLGVMIYGAKKKVSRVVGRYSLLRA